MSNLLKAQHLLEAIDRLAASDMPDGARETLLGYLPTDQPWFITASKKLLVARTMQSLVAAGRTVSRAAIIAGEQYHLDPESCRSYFYQVKAEIGR